MVQLFAAQVPRFDLTAAAPMAADDESYVKLVVFIVGILFVQCRCTPGLLPDTFLPSYNQSMSLTTLAGSEQSQSVINWLHSVSKHAPKDHGSSNHNVL